MQLNPDCMRNTLLFLEKVLSISSDLEFEGITIQVLAKNVNYPIQDLANTVLCLHEANFIVASILFGNDSIEELLITRITYSGYQFLESIRPDTVWEKIKLIASHLGSFSVSVISQSSSNIFAELISGFFSRRH